VPVRPRPPMTLETTRLARRRECLGLLILVVLSLLVMSVLRGLPIVLDIDDAMQLRKAVYRGDEALRGVRAMQFEELLTTIDLERLRGRTFGHKFILQTLGNPDKAHTTDHELYFAYGGQTVNAHTKTYLLRFDHRDRLISVYHSFVDVADLGPEYLPWDECAATSRPSSSVR
jgi:hypothetical protein